MNARAHYLSFALLAAAPGCATTGAPAEMEERDATAAMDFASVGASALAVSFRLHASNAAKPDHVVATGESLHNNDRYSLSLRANKPAYIYAVLVNAQGKPTLLNPSAADQLVAAGCELRLPRAGTFSLREPHGQDNIKVIAASKPLGPESRELCQDLGIPCAAAPAAATAPPACASKGKGQKTRDIDPALKIGQAGASGVAEVAFPFAHEP